MHLVWQAGHIPRTCSIYHIVSTDGGESWSDTMTVLDTNSPECPNSFRLFWGKNELLFLMTEVFLTTVDRTQLFLQAWDGEIWSEPELQDTIFEFEDPDTYRAVAFSCIQDFVSATNQLFLVACGSTKVIDDIWFMERPLGNREDWSLRFAPPPAWNAPDEIEKNAAVQNSLAIFAVDDEQYHTFWTAEDSDTLEQTIHYSSFIGNEWSRPLSIIESPEGSIQQAAFAIDKQRQRFLATWVDEESRKLYFSQAQISNAAIAINWQTPTQIHAIQESSEWPEVIVTEDGVIYLVFSIPVNEQRGIYLARSTDGGSSWSDPMKILDGTAIGWELVGRSRLAVDQNGNIQVAAIRHKSLLSMDDTELYYFQSLDNGLSWTSLKEPFDSEVVWHDIAVVAPDVAHLNWVSFSDNRTIIWHSYTENNGQDWSQPLPVASYSGENGILDLTTDQAGQLHLVYLDDLSLTHWMWDGLRWIDNVSLSVDKIIPGGALSQAVATSNSKLHVLFSGILAEADGVAESASNPAVATLAASQVNVDERYGLVHTSQDLNLPEVVPTIALTSPATPTPVGISGVTAVSPTPTLTPTPPVIDINAAPATNLPIYNPIGALIFSIAVVVLYHHSHLCGWLLSYETKSHMNNLISLYHKKVLSKDPLHFMDTSNLIFFCCPCARTTKCSRNHCFLNS